MYCHRIVYELSLLSLLIFNGIESTFFSNGIPEGKHVMLSYHSDSQGIVSKIHQILQDEHITVWFDEKRDMSNIYNRYEHQSDLSLTKLGDCTMRLFSLAVGVENAAVVCCFITSDYQKSEDCKLELQYAQKRHKRIIPCMLENIKTWKPCSWLELITKGVIHQRWASQVKIKSSPSQVKSSQT